MKTYTSPAGITVPVIGSGDLWRYAGGEHGRAPGLGTFAVVLDPETVAKIGPRWVYRAPNRPPIPTGHYGPEPPPLPKPREAWERCNCSKGEHVCGACGQPFWIEIHGMADGYCTHCYYRG